MVLNSRASGAECMEFTKDSNNNILEVSGTDNIYNFTMPNSDVTINVTYKIISYRVTFVESGLQAQVIQRNGTATSVTPSNNSYHEGFLGWYENPNCTENSRFDFNTQITRDIELYPKWQTIIDNTGNIPNRITTMLYSCTIKAYGIITEDTIPSIRTALNNLYAERNNILVSLDLSEIEITSLPYESFYNCRNLKKIVLPNTIESIGSSAFYQCTALDDLTLLGNSLVINQIAFGYCTSLTNLIISDSVKVIYDEAFFHCESLTNVTISEGVKTFGNKIFACCPITSITIPSSVIYIASGAFDSISTLSEIIFQDKVSNWKLTQSTKNETVNISETSPIENVTLFTNTYKRYTWRKIQE